MKNSLQHTESLQSRKQRLVQEAIWDAAIDLFTEKGFDATTIEDIAEAAGISRRSFFRYFNSKDDLLAQGIVAFAAALCEAIAHCPTRLKPLSAVEHCVLEVASAVTSQPRTRNIIHVAEMSPLARQAQMSRMPEAEERVASAFATRLRCKVETDLRPRLLAGLAFSTMESTMRVWMKHPNRGIASIVQSVFLSLTRIISGSTVSP